MLITRTEYDWRAEDDARILQRYAELASDPSRMSRAREIVKDSIADGKAALGLSPDIGPSRSRNPATVGKLPIIRK